MCRFAPLVALGLCAAASPLRAQAPQDADSRNLRLLARAESLYSRLQERRLVQEALDRERHRAVPVRVGDLEVIAPASAESRALLAGLEAAQALLGEFGAIPRPFLSSIVLVGVEATDTAAALAAPEYAGRRRVIVDATLRREAEWVGRTVALTVLQAFRATLDAEWRDWLPVDYGLRRTGRGGEALSWRSFLPTSNAGAACLGGGTDRCRLWLGLDRDPDPYAARFSPAELRGFLEVDRSPRISPLARPCLEGSDAACLAHARETGRPPLVAAGDEARRSLLRAVHDLHGPGALAAALADTSGGLGERLARAAGLGEDSLVREWRARAMGGEHPGPSRSGGREAVPALLFGGLLLFAASRSGRWR